MSRQSVLIWILVAVAMFGLPIHYMDAAVAEHRTTLQAEQAKLEPLRQQVAAIRQREGQLTERAARLEGLKDRLIAAQPFATIQGELTAMAARSGVTLGALTLEGPSAAGDLPEVVRYQATVQVTGDRNQFVEFIRQLENNRLLIEVPELSLRLQTTTVRGAVPRVDQVLVLGFYGSGAKR